MADSEETNNISFLQTLLNQTTSSSETTTSNDQPDTTVTDKPPFPRRQYRSARVLYEKQNPEEALKYPWDMVCKDDNNQLVAKARADFKAMDDDIKEQIKRWKETYGNPKQDSESKPKTTKKRSAAPSTQLMQIAKKLQKMYATQEQEALLKKAEIAQIIEALDDKKSLQ